MTESSPLRVWLSQAYFGNTLESYILSLAVFLGVLIGVRLVVTIVTRRLRTLAAKTTTDIDDFIVSLLAKIGPAVYFSVGLYIATRSLILPGSIETILRAFFIVILTVKVVQVLQASVDYFLTFWARRTARTDPTNAVALKNLAAIVRFVLWASAVLFILDNLGINITAMVAGLGIGGVAVALAAQAVLGDAFSSFAIFMDRPFAVGDFIIVGDLLGTVENIGFKTTRIRSLGGEQLIFSNSDLTNSRIRNYKRMEHRRIVFELGVIYQTSIEQVKAIPQIIEQVVREHELTKFDRAHFKRYGDFALIFEIVYNVLSPDYNKYMDVQQYINVRIFEAFHKAGIEFAYPTQQLYVTKSESAAT